MKLRVVAAALVAVATVPQGAVAVKTVIPKTCFDSQAEFEKFFVYNYPWGGTDHNGSARMAKSQISVSGGVLTITATKVSGQRPARHAGKDIAIKYLSGAVGAKEHFTVARGGGFDFSAELKATVTKGTWPAFWLSGVNSWPPEIDMAEWKGSGKISFNTFNTSSQVKALDVPYPDPASFHKIRCEIRDVNGQDVGIKFFMDEKLVTTQGGRGFVGKPMYLWVSCRLMATSG